LYDEYTYFIPIVELFRAGGVILSLSKDKRKGLPPWFDKLTMTPGAVMPFCNNLKI